MLADLVNLIFRHYYSNNLEKYKGAHQGESCYIFGDGPSIKWFDIKKFDDLSSICCGLLPFHKDFEKINIKYCVFIEPWVFASRIVQPNLDSLRKYKVVSKAYQNLMELYDDKEYFVHVSNIFSARGKNVNYVYKKIPNSYPKSAALNKFNLFGGSFHASLSLAYILGYSKVYLIGFDAWTIEPARNGHWYEAGRGIHFEPIGFAYDFLEILQEEMEIFSISIDGDSRNVTRILYETYTGEKPSFKENSELLSAENMDVLATYRAFRIYK